MRRSVFTCFVFVFLWVAESSCADVKSIKAHLANDEYQKALDATKAFDSPTPEIRQLMAQAKLQLVNQRSATNPEAGIWLPGEREEIEMLLKSAADEGYGPAMIDYGLVLSIGAEAMPEKAILQWASAFRIGEPQAALALYERYCSGLSIPVEISEIEPRVVAISEMETDSDSETDFTTMIADEDDDVLARRAKLSLAGSLATGSCGRLDKAAAQRSFDGMTGDADQMSVGWELGSIVSLFAGTSYQDTRFPVKANASEAFDWLAYKVRSGRASYFDYTDLAERLLTGTGTPKNFVSASSAVKACYREQKLQENISCLPFRVSRTAEDTLIASSRAGERLSATDKAALESLLGTIALEELQKTDSVWSWMFAESLGDSYYDGAFGSPDLERALEWFQLAAEAGSVRCQFLAGYMYSSGEGTAADGNEAVRFYKMAAANGNATAAHNLGWLYAYSGLVPKDDVQATNWYRQAADLGDLDSIAQIGRRIADGAGTLENDKEAVRWLTKAADAGQRVAQNDLAFMYANGEGVEQNFVVAYKWANLAGAAGADVSQIKSWLSGRMTRDEVSKGQSLSAAWKPVTLSQASSVASPSDGIEASARAEPDELTLEVQLGLVELGLLTGQADGQFGPKTKAAIEAFQRQQRLEVTGTVSPQLVTQIGRALSEAPAKKKRPKTADSSISTGTGFVVSSLGHLVTNAHVVTGCRKMTLANGKLLTMQAYDPLTDLALLKSSALEGISPLPLRAGTNLQLAESVAVAGFPLSGLVSPDLNVTLGNVSALSGPDGSKTLIQITAPVQPGNSGGPILDEAGTVVGVVVSKLDAIAVATITGDIPQNVNFGIALSELKSFLNKQGVSYTSQSEKTALKSAKVGELARASTFQIECH